MPDLCVSYVCLICVSHMCVSYVCLICMKRLPGASFISFSGGGGGGERKIRGRLSASHTEEARRTCSYLDTPPPRNNEEDIRGHIYKDM